MPKQNFHTDMAIQEMGGSLNEHNPFQISGAGGEVEKGPLPIYVPFVPLESEESTEMKTKFRSELDSTRSWSEMPSRILDAIRNRIKLSIWKGATDKGVVYGLMYVGHVDSVLENLGAEHGIPRGFPIIWMPGQWIKFFGFKVKFKNDDRNGETPIDADGVAWFLKYSGFLGHLMTWSDGGEFYWTAASKNSFDSTKTFSSDAKRLFEPFMTHELVLDLQVHGLHLNAEMMSENDQTHGASVLRESPVFTSMARGVFLDLVGHGEYDLPKTKGPVTYSGFADTIEFCTKHQLPVSEAVIATGVAAKEFLKLLQRLRDMMDYSSYKKVLGTIQAKYPNLVVIRPGTIEHDGILGERLEGIVAHAVLGQPPASHDDIVAMIEAGETTIFKWKLPGYTVTTMCCREAMNDKLTLGEFCHHVENWAPRWCLTEEGINYWTHFAWEIMLRAQEPDTDSKSLVARHIRLADAVQTSGIRVDIEETIATMCAKQTAMMVGPYTVVLPFASAKGDDYLGLEGALNEAGYVTTRKKKPIKSQRGFIYLTNEPSKPNKNTGPMFQMSLPDNLLPWQKARVGKFEKEHITPVASISDLLAKIQTRIEIESENALAAMDVITPAEKALRDYLQTLKASLVAKIAELDSKGLKGVFMPIGPQCAGKSTLTKILLAYGAKQCSADIHMGPEFNFFRLGDCHYRCKIDVLNALKGGFHAIVDNTNMKRIDCAQYKDICVYMGAELVSVPIAPELWLSCTDETRKSTIDALCVRSQIREKLEGKAISRDVIEKTINNCLTDYKTHTSTDAGPGDSLTKWLDIYPQPSFKEGVLVDRNVLMYRNLWVTKMGRLGLAQASGETIWKETPSRPNIIEERLRCELQRGNDEYHITLLDPEELKSVKGKVPDIVVEEQPDALGLGRLVDGNDEVIIVVLDWEWGQKFRASLGLPRKDFHITIAWTGIRDIHDVPKDATTIV